jgi:predicted ATPase with chaperone activity
MIDNQANTPTANPVLTPKVAELASNADDTAILPPAPKAIEEIGLSPSFLMELALKVIHYAEAPSAEHVARVLALPPKIVEQILDSLKSDRLCEIVGGGSTYDLTTNYRFRLTDKGESRAEQALDRCRYAGAAPVTISQYQRVVGKQSKAPWRPTQDAIDDALGRLIIEDRVADLISKALRSGRCAMVFGPSGNGKTHVLAEFLRNLEGEVVVPHSIYAYGQIIRILDQTVHVRKEAEPTPMTESSDPGMKRPAAKEDLYDRRWVRIQRPGLIVGGELTSESLELGYDPVTKFYQAPKHLKAQGGVLLVDDFGRQKIGPAELLNRWIMALERGTDNLLLRTGESIEVPFDIRLLFSTNLDPSDLADGAFLRRIPYKIQMPASPPEQFKAVVKQVCEREGVIVHDQDLDSATALLAERCSNPLSGSLARDIVSIVVDNARLTGADPVLTEAAVALAYLQFTGSPPEGYEMPQPAPAVRVPATRATPQPAREPASPPSEEAASPVSWVQPPTVDADEEAASGHPEEPAEKPRDASLAELAERITAAENQN